MLGIGCLNNGRPVRQVGKSNKPSDGLRLYFLQCRNGTESQTAALTLGTTVGDTDADFACFLCRLKKSDCVCLMCPFK